MSSYLHLKNNRSSILNSKTKKILLKEYYINLNSINLSNVIDSLQLGSNEENNILQLSKNDYLSSFNLVKKEIQNSYSSINKEIGTIGVVNFINQDGNKTINDGKFDNLMRQTISFIKEYKSFLDEKINFIDKKIHGNNNNLEIDILRILLEIKSFDVDTIMSNDYNYIKKEDIYKYYDQLGSEIKHYIDFEENNNVIHKLIYQYDLLQNVFSSYENTYVDKDYIFSNLIDNLNNIKNYLDLYLILKVSFECKLKLKLEY